jgi:hypothetical protein
VVEDIVRKQQAFLIFFLCISFLFRFSRPHDFLVVLVTLLFSHHKDMSAFSGHFDLISPEDPPPLVMEISFILAIKDSVKLHVNSSLDN